MSEIWKPIQGYNGIYQISNFGRVKSFKKWNGTNKRILNPKDNKCGYLFVSLYKNGEEKTKYIHVLMFESFNNYKLKKNECIHHMDENSKNNNLDNLKLMTKKGHLSFHNDGENNPKAILKFFDVVMIKKILDSESYKNHFIKLNDIAQILGVAMITISDIKRGKTWKHIEKELCL